MSMIKLKLSHEERLSILRQHRCAARSECVKAILAHTEPYFHPSVVMKRNGSITIRSHDSIPAITIRRDGHVTTKFPASHEHFIRIVSSGEMRIIADICYRHASAAAKIIGNRIKEWVPKDKAHVTRSYSPGFAGSFGFAYAIGYFYDKVMSRRIKPSADLVLRKAVRQHMNQEVLAISFKIASPFRAWRLWFRDNNLIVKYLPLYRQVLKDQPAALPLFHLAILAYRAIDESARVPDMPFEALSWTKRMFTLAGLSNPAWRHLLSCNVAEKVCWVSHLYREAECFERFSGVVRVLNMLVERNVQTKPFLVSRWGGVDLSPLRGVPPDPERMGLHLAFLEAWIRRQYLHIANGGTKEKLLEHARLDEYALVVDYIRRSDEVPSPPRGAGVNWWQGAQARWHAEVALREAMKYRQLFDWTDSYPQELRHYSSPTHSASIISESKQLVIEGLEMDHCVAGYDKECAAGWQYIYRIEGDERATARYELVRKPRGKLVFALVECRIIHNHQPTEKTMKFAQSLASHVTALVGRSDLGVLKEGTLMLMDEPVRAVDE